MTTGMQMHTMCVCDHILVVVSIRISLHAIGLIFLFFKDVRCLLRLFGVINMQMVSGEKVCQTQQAMKIRFQFFTDKKEEMERNIL